MSQVIDLSQNKYADQAGDNIVKIIEASAKAKQSQVDLQKQLLIDQITRARNRQDKQLEQQDEMNNWGKMFGQDGQTDASGMSANGMATGATPMKVGESPVQPIGGEIPKGGYTAQQPPPMSMADGSNQAEIQQMQQEQPMSMPDISPIDVKPSFQRPQYKGANLPSAMELAASAKLAGTKIEPSNLRLYHQLWQQAGRGQANEKGLKRLAEYSGIDKLVGDKKEDELSPSLQYRKDKRTEDLLTTIETNKPRKLMVTEAEDAAKRISSGIYGKVQRGWEKNLKPNSPALADYQKIKMVLLDAQLANVAFTKGAISDAEMKLFGEASANDELMSNPRMQVVFNKLNRFMKAQENAKINSYKKLYKDDPAEWPELQEDSSKYAVEENNNTTENNSTEKTYAGLTTKQARAQGFTGFNTDTNQWVK